jgi:hypothetical protein
MSLWNEQAGLRPTTTHSAHHDALQTSRWPDRASDTSVRRTTRDGSTSACAAKERRGGKRSATGGPRWFEERQEPPDLGITTPCGGRFLFDFASKVRLSDGGVALNSPAHATRQRREGRCYAAALSADSTASATSVTERPHIMQSKVSDGAPAPKFENDRANLIDMLQ